MTNVLSDALAAGIIAHVCEKDFAPKPLPVCTAWWDGRGSWDMAGQAQGSCSLQKLKLCFFFLQQDPVSNTDKFPSAETSRLHSKGNVIEMIDETLLDQTGVHYNICQV